MQKCLMTLFDIFSGQIQNEHEVAVDRFRLSQLKPIYTYD